jgi:membrane-associated phospholipid phosphatase
LFSRTDVRVEDVMAAGLLLVLVVLIGVRGVATRLLTIDEGFWDMSFIAAPLALLVFGASFRYAFRREGQESRPIRAIAGFLRDWLPFLVFLVSYESFGLDSTTAVLGADRDAALLRLDETLFGASPAITLQRIAFPLLTDAMTVFYFLHLVLPPVLALVLYRSDRRLFREFLLAILVCGFLGYVGYALVPAAGPQVAFPERYDAPLTGRLYAPVTGLVDAARAPRDAFPSLHVGLSSVVLYYAWKRGRTAFFVALPFVLGNWFSTLYLRFHYMVDVIAGWLVAAAAIALVGRLLRLETRLKGLAGLAPAVAAVPGRTP